MPTFTQYQFDEFRLDPVNTCLWRGAQEIRLAPRLFAVLNCLIRQRGQLVSKEMLIQTAWPDAVVSDASLTTCIRELRQVLGDDSKRPRYIETLHRRGYRFIGSAPGAGQNPAIGTLASAARETDRQCELARMKALADGKIRLAGQLRRWLIGLVTLCLMLVVIALSLWLERQEVKVPVGRGVPVCRSSENHSHALAFFPLRRTPGFVRGYPHDTRGLRLGKRFQTSSLLTLTGCCLPRMAISPIGTSG
jgi:DNA-binding winged helix-turn-helix (wHTH) protein